MRAFFDVSSSGTLPATAVIPKTSNASGAPSANKMATASSCPGSVSMMILRVMQALAFRLNWAAELGKLPGLKSGSTRTHGCQGQPYGKRNASRMASYCEAGASLRGMADDCERGAGHGMKLAFVTMVWRDYWLLERWVAHNSQSVDRSALYVINHGQDPEVARIAQGCNIIGVPRDEMPIDLTRRRWDLLGGVTNGLLAFYDRVICTDVDEFLIHASGVPITAYLQVAELDDDAFSPVGLNLIPTPEDGGTGPILSRHPNAMISAKYTKPCVAQRRVVYTVGGHGLQRGSFRIDPNLLLVHLHYVTPDYAERMAARQEIVAQSKAENDRSEEKVEVAKRYWINWSDPAYIREKELGLFGRADELDVSGGFEPAAGRLRAATVTEGRKTVVEPEIMNKAPLRVVLPEALQGAIEDRL